jgi:hypothetical protein
LAFFRSPHEANPIRLAPRRINDHDSFPFSRFIPPIALISPEEVGMMNRTRARTNAHMLNHNVPCRKKSLMVAPFPQGYRQYVKIF